MPPLAEDIPAPTLHADSARGGLIAPGVAYRYYWIGEGPWAVHVLDVDRAQCWNLVAAKGAATAAGRSRTSEIVAHRARAGREPARLAGGVNADFFRFAPAGVPTGVHVEDGRLITGPINRPAVVIDSAGAIELDTLRTAGWLAAPTFGTEISGWNRPLPGGLSVFDRHWGAATDSASGAIEVVVSALPRGLVLGVDTLSDGVAIPPDGAVLVLGRLGAQVNRLRFGGLRAGVDSVTIAIALTPTHPRVAVGGFPILLREGAEVPGLDSAGGPGFGPRRHPRTAVGLSAAGRRLMLVVVDGRQLPHSDGMTLRELARLMLDLGATDAINLDGGGSSTMVVVGASGRSSEPRVVNRPSDEQGERPVGNALLVERSECAPPR